MLMESIYSRKLQYKKFNEKPYPSIFSPIGPKTNSPHILVLFKFSFCPQLQELNNPICLVEVTYNEAYP